MTLAIPSDAFSISYEPGSDLLLGEWPQPIPMAQLAACYESLLAAAQARGGCRFWRLDVRPRNWHSAELAHWFTTEFVPRAVAALGQPLFIAYLVADEQQARIESAATEALLRQTARANCYPFYFRYEAAALAWLRDQQQADLRGPLSHPRGAAATR